MDSLVNSSCTVGKELNPENRFVIDVSHLPRNLAERNERNHIAHHDFKQSNQRQ